MLTTDSLKGYMIDGEIPKTAIQVAPDAISYPSELDEEDWRIILTNCNAFHGWYLDDSTNEVKIAPKPAFRLRQRHLDIGVREDEPGDKGNGSVSIAPEGNQHEPRPERDRESAAIPTYRTSDKASIEVRSVDNVRHESSVKNHFERDAFDGNITGGYAGFGVSISGGRDSSKQSGDSKTTGSYTRTMVGKYMLPRVTVLLDPEDLEATDELIKHVTNVQDAANSDQVSDFYKKFGQVFAHEITLGGVLTSTRNLEMKEGSTETQSKEDFKTAIGMSVTTPFSASGDANYHGSSGEDKGKIKTDRDFNDRVAFNATGGNTLMAFRY
ncbi:hypothetical protein MMYC01_205647 [Madurella mycetomatis]|uniref:MACPF domain-containing protein n=1 Tax=Madurella mycetomatis TaxID=100816 RepID=A0A175W599_9PEZI|nr:hypothetical protein MMYC01_205647 [Madurella mycetomatis]